MGSDSLANLNFFHQSTPLSCNWRVGKRSLTELRFAELAISIYSMATGGEVQIESEDGVPVVLRVKRKRTEDPAESLGVFQSHIALGS